MNSIHTEIEINAPIEKVWGVLMDFDSYPDWNPFIRKISGEKREGGKLKVTIQPPDSKPMNFKPTCLKYTENVEFRWLGNFIVPGVFDGEHCFRLKQIAPGKTKLIQSENFKGFLVSMMWKKMEGKTLKGFEMMNLSLKERAEK